MAIDLMLNDVEGIEYEIEIGKMTQESTKVDERKQIKEIDSDDCHLHSI